MNLPNKLTLLRILLVPVFIVFFLADSITGNYLFAAGVFIAASITDFFDGRIARKHGLVTDFGKFMDPLADKLLVTAAIIGFVGIGLTPSWAAVIIIAREFAVTSLRTLGASSGIVIAADALGKLKTVCQMIWIIASLLILGFEQAAQGSEQLIGSLMLIADVLMYISVAVTLVSGCNYLWKNRQLFKINN